MVLASLSGGASREEVTKYLMETYDLKEYSVYELDDYTQVVFKNIKFLTDFHKILL
jgi:hypothetical protein